MLKTVHGRWGRILLVLLALVFSKAHASLAELSDEDLSEVSGQAFININNDAVNNVNFTRVNLGLNVDTQLNVKTLKLGQYDRPGEAPGSADIHIDNFALGTVNDATGQVNPFKIKDPYVELAYEGKKVVGLRIGFGEAQGVLSGDLKSLTGNLPVGLRGRGGELANYIPYDDGVVPALVRALLRDYEGILRPPGIFHNAEFTAEAQMMTPNGAPDALRATYMGLTNGTSLKTNANLLQFVGSILGILTVRNCEVVSIPTCFPIANFQSIPIGGTLDSKTGLVSGDPSKGFFISLQTKDLAWRDQQNPAQLIKTTAGAFLNIPKNADGKPSINLGVVQALQGMVRQDTCFGPLNKGC